MGWEWSSVMGFGLLGGGTRYLVGIVIILSMSRRRVHHLIHLQYIAFPVENPLKKDKNIFYNFFTK